METNVATTIGTSLETSPCETAGGAEVGALGSSGGGLRRMADSRIPAEREAAGVGLGAVLRGAAGVTAGALVMPSVAHALRAELVPRAGGAVAASADGIALHTGVAVAPAARPDADPPHIRRPAASAAAAVSSARPPNAASAAPAELQEGNEWGAGGATVMGLQQAQQGLRGDGLLGEGLRGEGLRGEGLRGEGLRGEGLGHGHGPEEVGLEDEEEMAAAAAAAAYAKRMRRAGQISTVGQLVAGGIAGAVSKTCTAPLARLTILFQVQGMHDASAARRRPSIFGEARRIVAEEGALAFWKGNTVTIVHRLPYSAINFFAYESYKSMLETMAANSFPSPDIPPTHAHHALQPNQQYQLQQQQQQQQQHEQGWQAARRGVVDMGVKFLAGGGAGCTAATITYPLDLVRTRLAAQTKSRYYKGIVGTLSTIVRDEGLLGLYKGMGATLLVCACLFLLWLGVGPNLAINFCVYETVKANWVRRHPDMPVPLVSLGCGSLAGICSSSGPPLLASLSLLLLSSTSPLVLHTPLIQPISFALPLPSPFPLAHPYSPSLTCFAAHLNPAFILPHLLPVSPSSRNTPATFPLDLVRRRMQLEGAGGRQPSQRRTIPQMLAHVVRTEGWRALYRGIVPEYAKVVPGYFILRCEVAAAAPCAKGTRYGASLRKQVKKMEVSQHAKYFCEFCGKFSVKRQVVGIWHCKHCNKTKAGGAYVLNTAAAVTVRSTIRRLREQVEI
ncbi:unnamed protein product [Closterium sp. NIES-64]|nr:unnamed protein product [Closterium sp. NIES-64]